MIGMDFYLFKPDFSVILNPGVWRAAATQVSFSLSIGFGGMLSLASYNPREHNCYKDAAIVTIADATMSILGGTAVFSFVVFSCFTCYRFDLEFLDSCLLSCPFPSRKLSRVELDSPLSVSFD